MKATKEHIQAWKQQYKQIYKITIDGYTAYLKKPGRKEIGYAAIIGANNPMAFNEAILNTCWLDGYEKIKTNEDLFLAACGKISEIIKSKNWRIKKVIEATREAIAFNFIEKINCMLRYYNICNNPEELTDKEWALKYNILKTLIKKRFI